MPRRWLSFRAYRDGNSQDVESNNINSQPRFDFAFTSEPEALIEQDEPSASPTLRPTTSGGDRPRSRRRPDLSLLIERPKTSHSFLQRKSFSFAHLDNSHIGLAFGSPSCPPGPSGSELSTMPSNESTETTVEAGSLSNPLIRSRKWKIGSLFRSRSRAARKPRTRSPQPHLNDNTNNATPTTDVQYSPISPLTLDLEKMHSPLRFEIDQQEITSQPPEQSAQAVLALAYQTKTLRTSVVQSSNEIKGYNATQQSRLLVRRSKIFSQLLVKEVTESTDRDVEVPSLSRPLTSPLSIQPPYYARNCGSNASGGRYSLFPATPTSEKPQTQVGSPRPTRQRSSTAPSSQDLPVISTNPDVPERPSTSLQMAKPLRSETCQELSYEAVTTIQHSHHDSHASSEGDIFFDVRSFEDAHDQNNQQFEMTRPPSAVVQLARSRSNARKLRQGKSVTELSVEEQGQKYKSGTKITSEQLGQTIAALKMLALPELPVQDTDSAGPKPQARREESRCKPSRDKGDNKSGRSDADGFQKYSLQGGSHVKTKISDTNTAFAELETTKQRDLSGLRAGNTPDGAGLERSFTAPLPALTSNPVGKANTQLEATRRPLSPSPPPVPVKDTKHVPVPKRSSSQMKEKKICQNCTRPVRPRRSNTSSTLIQKPESSTSQQRRPPARAVTVPIPKVTNAPISKYSSPPLFAKVNPELSNGKQSSTAVAYVKPAAEVAVARTVSLSRRPSAKIVNPTRKTSKREQPKEDVTEKKVTLNMPVVQEVEMKHKPGLSLNIILETATIPPSSPKPPPTPNTTDGKTPGVITTVTPILVPLLST